jgi:3-isopropylmalate/(R)-2-methylmalate dehydratase small subunit
MDDLKGKVWKFANDVDTDAIVAGQYLDASMEEILPHVFESIRPEFAARVRVGDLIVAGTNFGCGSSREQAPAALKAAGIACVVADSFGRIFFRNAIAIGLPVLTCRGAGDAFEEGMTACVSMDMFQVSCREKGVVLKGDPMSGEMSAILEKGGILAYLKCTNG